jgi:hypothetical protein
MIASEAGALPFSAWRAHRQARDPLSAAQALLRGDAGPASALLAGWAFAPDATLRAHALRALLDTPPNPPPALAGLHLGEPPLLPDGPHRSGRGHLLSVAAQLPPREGALGLDDRLAWGLGALAETGAEVALRERGAWLRRAPIPDPTADGAAAQMWARFFKGDFWGARPLFTKHFQSPARKAFRGALLAARVPLPEHEPYLKELDETLFWYMVGGGEGAPGWQEVAARVYESRSAAAGPLDHHAQALIPETWEKAVGCPELTGRSWGALIARLWPAASGPLARALCLQRQLIGKPDRIEPLTDLMIALRLIARWGDAEAPRCHPDEDWSLVLRHRNRTRGRLRALVMEGAPEVLAAATQPGPGLYEYTARAVRIYAWCRATGVLRRHHLPAWEESLTPPCDGAEGLLDELSAEAVAALRCWLLLVALRDRWEALRHWSATGSWLHKPDAQWGRLLQEALPRVLKDRDLGYERLRAELALGLTGHVNAMAPLFAQLEAAGPAGLKATLAAAWHPEVPRPERLSPGALDRLRAMRAATHPLGES